MNLYLCVKFIIDKFAKVGRVNILEVKGHFLMDYMVIEDHIVFLNHFLTLAKQYNFAVIQ